MNASNVQTSSTPAAAAASTGSSTLRPRPNRLISGLSEGDETTFDPEQTPPRRIASPLPSPFDSRSASPIPAPHPQRTGSSQNQHLNVRDSRPRKAQLGGQPRSRTASPNPLASLWGSSWNTIQGLASELLGNDQSVGGVNGTGARQRRPLSKLNSQRSVSANSQGSQWGPAATSAPSAASIGAGTREEREAAIRAEKRKNLLLRGDSNYAGTLGQFKRRLSDEHESFSAPPDQDDRSALVYLHPVKKDDTLAGITIRYNISANALRKANRMWPNDTVQSRTTLTLPVSACGVKGRPVSNGEAVDLLGSESEALSAGQAEEVETPTATVPNGRADHSREASISSKASKKDNASVTGSNVDSEAPWHHDSWVLLPGNSRPTEIARLSRRNLGFFPPSRRKSVSFSDLDSPSTSLELARSGLADEVKSVNTSPLRTTTSLTQASRRTRRLSNADNGYYPSYMAGPGGVGTMNRNVHFPGPAQDGLNKMFAKYFTDVAPPRGQVDLSHPDIPGYSGRGTPMGSGTTTPNSRGNKNLNLENVGGQIESWVRRVASQAKNSMGPSEGLRLARGPRASVGTGGKGTGGVGDLIEMTNEFEIGDDDDDGGNDNDETPTRGRQEGSGYLEQQTGSSSTDYFSGATARDRARPSTSRSKKGD